jgi:hypothetical protein
LGQVPISQSECSHAYLTFHKALQFEAQQQQILFQHWLQEPTKGKKFQVYSKQAGRMTVIQWL